MTLLRTRGIIEVVSDRQRLLPGGAREAQLRALVAQAVAASAADVDLFELRERDLTSRELFQLAREVVAAVSESRMKVLVNDRLDVALASGAHGVHLPAAGLHALDVRALAPHGFVVVRSIHGSEAAGAGADLAVFGTVFETRSKQPGHWTAGVEGLASAVRNAAVPVLAIGGIIERTVDQVAPICAGIAAIGWFATTDAGRMAEAVQRVRRAFDTIRPVI